MSFRFEYRGKVCIVTGASSGIGAAFARALDAHGAHVILFARRGEYLKSVASTLAQPHLIIVGDITKAEDRQQLIESTVARFGRIDMLINNAGRGSHPRPYAQQDPTEIDALMDLNLRAPLHLIRLVLPGMLAQQQGLIINVSSPAAVVNVPVSLLYNISKAGLSASNENLMRQLRGTGVHVMDFRPGFTYSEMITDKQARQIPFVIPVRQAEPVVRQALQAAQRGKPICMTGGMVIRLGIWLNKFFPRLIDRFRPDVDL